MKIECIKDGANHEHPTWEELMWCVGTRDIVVRVSAPPAPAKAAGSVPMRPVSGAPAMRDPDAPPTGRQLSYIMGLGGSWRDAKMDTKAAASALITALQDPEIAGVFKMPPPETPNDSDLWEGFPQELRWRKGELPPQWMSFDESTGRLSGIPEPKFPPLMTEKEMEAAMRRGGLSEREIREARERAERNIKKAEVARLARAGGVVEKYDKDMRPVFDPPLPPPPVAAKPVPVASKMPRLDVMKPMLDRIPDGYFAVELDEGLRFMRVSRPKKGNMAGAFKVQICSGGNNFDGAVLWPSGRWSIYEYGKMFDLEEYLLHLMTDHRAASRRYAKEIDRCCRCNTRLTDARSRHYGIGPECEKHMPGYIHEIDLYEAEMKGL